MKLIENLYKFVIKVRAWWNLIDHRWRVEQNEKKHYL